MGLDLDIYKDSKEVKQLNQLYNDYDKLELAYGEDNIPDDIIKEIDSKVEALDEEMGEELYFRKNYALVTKIHSFFKGSPQHGYLTKEQMIKLIDCVRTSYEGEKFRDRIVKHFEEYIEEADKFFFVASW